MHRDDAIAFACGPLCLQIHSVLPLAMQPVSIQHHPIQPETDVVTWLARDTRFLTLIKTVSGTRVYDHADDLLYYANPNTELHKDCPEGHAFLCQTVCDRLPDGTLTPRLLITDLVCPRVECPRQRGDTLRRLTPMFSHVCHVQWAGDKQALESFVAQGMPHEVEALVALRAPLQITRGPTTCIAALECLRADGLAQ
jgi:hypothetical protein